MLALVAAAPAAEVVATPGYVLRQRTRAQGRHLPSHAQSRKAAVPANGAPGSALPEFWEGHPGPPEIGVRPNKRAQPGTADDVIAAVRNAAAGTASLSPELLTRFTQALRRPPPPDPLQPLSPREREVLRLIARGHSNRQIARDLTIGEQTVKTHVRSILVKLGLQDRVQAAIFALRHETPLN